MKLYPVAGHRIYISDDPFDEVDGDITEGDVDDLDYTEIDGWRQMGSFGDTAQVINTPLINRAREIKQKGTRNAGTMQNVFAVLPADAGQIALIAAEKTPHNYAFKIEFPDAPEGGTPTTRYFVGLVMNAQETGGDANTVRNLESTIEINSNVVRVPAEEPPPGP